MVYTSQYVLLLYAVLVLGPGVYTGGVVYVEPAHPPSGEDRPPLLQINRLPC